MSELTTGWKRMFSVPSLYRLTQQMIGSESSRRRFINEIVRPSLGDRVLDIGCGTGDLLSLLVETPGLAYVGHDPSTGYIEAARERFGDRGEFLVGGVGEVPLEDASFDICVAKGVLHHLDDDLAEQLCDDAARMLRPGGRLVTMDPVFVDGQSRIARVFAERDRGQNVRQVEGYERFARSHFGSVRSSIHHDLLRVPYSHALLVCTEPRSVA